MASEGEIIDKKKTHREPHSGRKAEKKAKKNIKDVKSKEKNPKAFTFNSAIKAERRFRRTEDIKTKKQHIPLVDRTPVEPPPVIVAVVGPPKVGKTTLVKCLIKNFTKQPLTVVKGPVTLVSGKKRRLTIMECNNDINCMIDISKVADLVLLLIDASFGFEMEIFEFLNICQVHGMPRIMGVLTHLDMLKHSKQVKQTKKLLKHRFWTEVYAGAKLFYLSGLLHGEYLRNEVKNLGRFISVMKFRPLTWQTSHPYMLVDRIEDITSPESIRQNPVVDRQICLYGFVRGIPLNKTSNIHIPGCGDHKIHSVSFLPDPCPLPEKQKRRSLVEKEKLIYAPFSGVGGIVYDKDAVYVELAGSHSHADQEGEGKELTTSLMEVLEPLDTKMAHSEVQLFSGAEPITAAHFQAHEKKVTEGEGKKYRWMNEDEKEESENGQMSTSACVESDHNVSGESPESKTETMTAAPSGKKRTRSHITLPPTKRMKSSNHIQEINKRLAKDLGESDDNDDDDDNDDNDESLELSENDIKLEDTSSDNINIGQRDLYKSPAKSSSHTIKNKISLILSQLDKKKEEFDNETETAGADVESEEEEDDKSSGISSGAPSDEESDNESSAVQWKAKIVEKAASAYFERQENSASLWKFVYNDSGVSGPGTSQSDKSDQEQVGGLFRKVSLEQKQQSEEHDLQDGFDCSRFQVFRSRDWSKEEVLDLIRDCFVTGKWDESEDAENLLQLDDASVGSGSDVYGDFEDMETGEKHVSKGEENNEKPAETSSDKLLTRKQLIEKKKKLKEKFDAEYDEKEGDFTYYDELKQEVSRQSQINKSEFEGLDDDLRVQLEGFRPGMYVRVEVPQVPCELVINFDPTYPLIVGGLLPGEENAGCVQVRVKKHRWYSRILKNRDPLIVSLGWRRFQTLPVFAKLEDNLRHRMLKYTPQHVSCIAHFWGPITPQGTGFLAVQDVTNKEPGFRIAATGSIVELDKSVKVMKKLKLTGLPIKVYKKTAFIRGMFTSGLEVAKFEGAKIRTVSGIRGQIKKAVGKPEGSFRATFEDKIQLSDIVFCRTWYQVEIPKLYNPVLSLLLPPEKKNLWQGMKTVGQLKREQGIRSEPNYDSLYTPIKREPKVFPPLVIPVGLQKNLPYINKPKRKEEKSKKQQFQAGRVAVIRNPSEQKAAKLIQMIRTSYKYKQKKTKEIEKKKKEERKKVLRREEEKAIRRQKQLRQEVFRTLSKMNKNKVQRK